MRLAIWLLLFPFFSCEANPTFSTDTPLLWRDTFPKEALQFTMLYDLEKPDKTFELPKELNEISGLTLSKNGKRLIAVQDEEGDIFYISTKNGKVKKKIKFYKDGDYEGIELVDSQVFVLKSTGTLYEILNPKEKDKDNIKLNKYNDELNKSHNVEGLAYDKKNNRLLLACKGNGDKEYKLEKSIYAFDLKTHSINKTPVYTVSQDAILNFLGAGQVIKKLEQLSSQFDPTQSYFGFSPSAIAIHPVTGDVYLTSSVGKLLIVLNSAGQLVFIEKLDKKIHRQPEGIAFGNDGTLYISNEGKKGNAKIQVFKAR